MWQASRIDYKSLQGVMQRGIHGAVRQKCEVQGEVSSWNQQAADIERKARQLQLDMEEIEREQLLVKRRIMHQPMDVKQALRVRDNLCALYTVHESA
jgi:hypothetical protein